MADAQTQSRAHTRRLTICNRKGLHARAAAKFVKTAEQFSAECLVDKEHNGAPLGQQVSAHSILGLMMLGADCDSAILLSAQGEDAHALLQALEELVANRFGEAE